MQSGVEVGALSILDESFVAFCSQPAPEYKLCGFTESGCCAESHSVSCPRTCDSRKEHVQGQLPFAF